MHRYIPVSETGIAAREKGHRRFAVIIDRDRQRRRKPARPTLRNAPLRLFLVLMAMHIYRDRNRRGGERSERGLANRGPVESR